MQHRGISDLSKHPDAATEPRTRNEGPYAAPHASGGTEVDRQPIGDTVRMLRPVISDGADAVPDENALR